MKPYLIDGVRYSEIQATSLCLSGPGKIIEKYTPGFVFEKGTARELLNLKQ